MDEAPAQGEAAPDAAEKGLRVYVVVLDGLKPDEIRETLTPTLAELKKNGTWYKEARAVFPAETIPNHVAMMTGVPPSRNGIVGNDYWVPGDHTKYRMQYPSLLGADTLTTRLEERCTVSTATVLSKGYLWGIFRGEPSEPGGVANDADPRRPDPANPQNQRQADLHWNPSSQPGYIPDPDDHVVDQTTMGGFLDWINSEPAAPQFAFVNLGDIDRSGHVDMSGNAGGISAFRQAALADTDTQVKKLVDNLKASGAWQQTVLIFASDHGMDWSVPDNTVAQRDVTISARSIDVTRILSAPTDPDGNPATPTTEPGYAYDSTGTPGRSVPGSKGDFSTVPGGGTATVWMEEPDAIADAARRIMAYRTPTGEAPVDFVATREPVPGLDNPTLADLDMDHPANGDIVVFAKQGWAVRDRASSNPIPGNHGHAVTQHSTLMVTGGSPLLDDAAEEVDGAKVFDPPATPFSKPSDGPGNLSVAPTVSALFGLPDIPGGYSRSPLTEAFKDYALAPHAPCQGASAPKSIEAPGPGDTGTPDTGTTDAGTDTGTTGTGTTDTGTTDAGTTDSGDTGTTPDTSSRGPQETTRSAPPRLTRFSVTPTAFLAKAMRPRASRLRTGARVRYTSTASATTRFTVKRLKKGHRQGRRCVLRKARAGVGARPCWVYVRVRGSFAHQTVTGRNAFRFTGWVGGRKLRPGAYRMLAVARNSAGRSRTARANFRVARR